MTLTFDLTLTFNKFLQVVKVHVHAKFHQAECSDSRVICPQTFLRYLAMVKNPKIRSCNLDLWSMTLRLKRVHAVVKEHVCAKFHPAKYSGSWVIVRIEKKNRTKTIQSVQTVMYCRNQFVLLIESMQRNWNELNCSDILQFSSVHQLSLCRCLKAASTCVVRLVLVHWCIERLHFLTWLKSSRLDLSQVSSLRSKYLLRPEFN